MDSGGLHSCIGDDNHMTIKLFPRADALYKVVIPQQRPFEPIAKKASTQQLNDVHCQQLNSVVDYSMLLCLLPLFDIVRL